MCFFNKNQSNCFLPLDSYEKPSSAAIAFLLLDCCEKLSSAAKTGCFALFAVQDDGPLLLASLFAMSSEITLSSSLAEFYSQWSMKTPQARD